MSGIFEKIVGAAYTFPSPAKAVAVYRFSFKQLKKRIKVLLLFDIKKRWGSRIVSKLKRTLKQKDVEKDLKTTQAKSQKFPELEHEDIEARLSSLDKINGKNKKQKWDIVKLESNTFKIDNPKTKL